MLRTQRLRTALRGRVMSHLALDVSMAHRRRPPLKRVDNRLILPGVVAGLVRNALPSGARRRLLKNLWIELKRFGAPGVRNVELSRIRGIEGIRVEGAVARHEPLVLSALSQLLECERIFELGTYRGDTTWLLAHNLPTARIYTLDFASRQDAARAELELTDWADYFTTWERGTRFSDTPEARRITQLYGDSATFDFSPYHGSIDLVFVDASHSYSYVKSDTEAAFRMLSELGTIVWDDYTHYSGVYAYLNDLAPSLDRPIFHILGTRLALYSRWQVVVPRE
jgi:predicted O-methyltransferase YrrM